MESGYTRPQKERLRKRKLRKLKQALASQAKARAPGKKGMHGSTKELLAKVQGKPPRPRDARMDVDPAHASRAVLLAVDGRRSAEVSRGGGEGPLGSADPGRERQAHV